MTLDGKLAERLVRDGLLAPGDAVLVGVSGGPDSVALLHVLHEIGPSLSLRLEAAHVEHGARGREGRDDAGFVRAVADGLSVPFHLTRLDLTASARRSGAGNFEALARDGRYRFFAEVARAGGIGKIAVGHNRGDQVETMLMWLLRGCGPEGLMGMPAARALDQHARRAQGAGSPLLIRPLLEVSRDEVLEYLASRGLDYREDRTNRDTRYLRNWIRRTVLPELREHTDDGLEQRLARLAGMMRSDNALLERRVAEVYPQVSRQDALDRAAFLALEPELRPRVARFWLGRVLGTLRRIGFAHVDAVLHLIGGTRPHARVSLPGAWTAVREYETIRLVPGHETGGDYSHPLPLEGDVLVPEAGLRLTTWRSRSLQRPTDPCEAAFDFGAVEGAAGALQVRNARPGDRFRPLGMAGHKKLKDLFIEKKVPRSRRRILPLVLAGDAIVWIPGCARGAFAALEPDSQAAWRVRISPEVSPSPAGTRSGG